MNSTYVYTENKFGIDADLGASFSKSAGKGATIGAAAGTVVPGIGNVAGGAIGTVVGGITSIFGGSKKFSDCGSKQQQIAQVFQQYFTTQDLQEIAADARQNVGDITGSTAYDLAFHYAGGDDCQTTSSEGKAWKRRVDQRLAQRRQQAQQAATKSANPIAAAVGGGSTGKYVLVGGGVLGLGLIVATMAK